MSFKGELYVNRALIIAVLVLTVVPRGEGQEQSARGTPGTSVEEAIRKLDNERIQGQVHADATTLDRIYAADFIGVPTRFGCASTKTRLSRLAFQQ